MQGIFIIGKTDRKERKMEYQKTVEGKKVFNIWGSCNGCYGCPSAPATREEYNLSKNGSSSLCVDAYEPHAKGCKQYKKEYEF